MDALGQFGEHRINNAERQPQAQQPQQPQQPHLQLRHRAKQERQDIDDFCGGYDQGCQSLGLTWIFLTRTVLLWNIFPHLSGAWSYDWAVGSEDKERVNNRNVPH